MNAATIEVTCPKCSNALSVEGVGTFSCPHCGQPLEIEKPVALGFPPKPTHLFPPASLPCSKTKVNNGLGWWTAVSVIAALILVPSILGFIALVIMLMMAVNLKGAGTVGGMTVAMMIPLLIAIAIGEGLRAWAKSKKFTLVCSQCGHDTTKHAKVCAQCKTEFAQPRKKLFWFF